MGGNRLGIGASRACRLPNQGRPMSSSSADIERAIEQQFHPISDDIAEQLELIRRTAKTLREHGGDQGAIDKLEESYSELLQLQGQNRNVERALRDLQGSNLNGKRTINEALNKVVDVEGDKDLNRKLKQFRKMAQCNHVDEDEDLVVEETEMTKIPKCPITQLEMSDTDRERCPMKNRCGHHFSRAGIDSHLKKKRGGAAVCPIVGCGAPMSKDSVTEDREMVMQIKHFLKRQNEDDDEVAYTQID